MKNVYYYLLYYHNVIQNITKKKLQTNVLQLFWKEITLNKKNKKNILKKISIYSQNIPKKSLYVINIRNNNIKVKK